MYQSESSIARLQHRVGQRLSNPVLRVLTVILALSMVIGGAGLLVTSATRADALAPVTPHPETGAASGPVVIAPHALNQRLLSGDEPPLLLDFSDPDRYRAGHVPGAINANWRDSIEVDVPSFGQVLSQRDDLAAWIGGLGIDGSRDVVVYDDALNAHASRVVWILHFLGIQRAAVLDGGMPAWSGAGFDTDTTTHAPPTVVPPEINRSMGRIISTPELHESLTGPLPAIVDVRSDAERSSDLDGTILTGEIARSIRMPSAALLSSNGQFRPTPELARMFTDAGLTSSTPIVLYGLLGSDTGTAWLALTLAGYTDVRVYDEGFMRWADPSSGLPVDQLTPA